MTIFSAAQSTAGNIVNDVAGTRASSHKARYFFEGMAILFPVIAVIGLLPAIRPLVPEHCLLIGLSISTAH
jgi:hypothetical protein